MLIGVRKRFVFVANTKTASTSVEHALAGHAEIMRPGGPDRKHSPLAGILADYRFLFQNPQFPFDSFFRFGIMREPLSWIDSWYRYRRGNKVDSPLPAAMTFEEFWRTRDWNIVNDAGRKNLQGNMFRGADGKVLADAIVPYERMDDYIPTILELLKIPRKLQRKNVSRLPRDETPLPQILRDEMLDFYKDDYALYASLDALNATGMEKLRTMAAAKDRG